MKINLFFTMILIFIFFTCKQSAINKTENNTAFLKIKDSYEREVVLNKKPERIISLAPNVTEIIFKLGAGNSLVGRTDYCDFPTEAKKITSVGEMISPNIEVVVSLKPDLVIASTHFQKETLSIFEKLKIPVFVGVLKKDYSDTYVLIKNIGTIIGRNEEAEVIIKNMKERFIFIEEKSKMKKNKPKVYYMISFGSEGDFTAGADSYISYFIKTAGGINAGDDITGWQYSVENLFKNEPDLIICSKYNNMKSRIENDPVYSKLRAVKNKKVFEIDNNMIDRMSPRNIDGLEALAKIIDPDIFK